MKRDFILDVHFFDHKGTSVTIIGKKEKGHMPLIGFHDKDGETIGWLKDKDIEVFAVNILKALGSKKLKVPGEYEGFK